MLFLPALVIATATAFAAPVPVAPQAPAAPQGPGADPTPNIGGAMKEATPPPNQTKPGAPAQETPVIIQQGETPFSLAEGEKLFVKDFKLEGAEQADKAQLTALLAPYRNRELTMAEITEAANKLTLFYRNKGYLVAKAYVPKQDARGGTLVIKIIMGEYGKITLKNTSHVRDFLLQGVFEEATREASPVVTQAGLERAILIVRDMPGSKIPTVTIAPGATPGTSDFVVNAEAAHRLTGYLMADNQGSRFTGRDRVYGGVDINSPTGMADKLSVSGMVTTEATDLWNVRLAYGFPLAYNGLRGEIAASRTNYNLGGTYSDLNATGVADTIEGTVTYPVKKSRDESIDLSMNIAYKELKDDLLAGDSKNPRTAVVGTFAMQREAYGSLFGHNLFTTLSGGFSLGSLKINDAIQEGLNAAGANTEGRYLKVNLGFSANLELTQKLSVKGSFKLQQVLSGNNLDSSEQFFISGISGVKAYSESVGFDDGTLANIEVRYALPTLLGINHAVGLFFDNGWAYAESGNYTAPSSFVLNDAGLGYYISYKQLFCTVQLAQPVGHTSGVNDPGTRGLLQLGASF